MKIPEVRNSVSWVPFKVTLSADGNELGTATAFIYEYNERTFLITNYHVVSGIDPNTRMILGGGIAVPKTIALRLPFKAGEQVGKQKTVEWKDSIINLYKDEAGAEPIWHVHPKHGGVFDVVAIPLGEIELTYLRHAKSPEHDLDDFLVRPGLDAFVVGFPKGMSGGGHFPIWKRATVATEIDFEIDDLPKFFIDTATREGMSGSPVYAQISGYWMATGSSAPEEARIGTGAQFVGVYSGRINAEDEFKAQLGVVWKEEGLVELLDAIPPENASDEAPE